jgi:hypothetical protein
VRAAGSSGFHDSVFFIISISDGTGVNKGYFQMRVIIAHEITLVSMREFF